MSLSPALKSPDLNSPEHRALVALSKGEAEPHQQTLALSVIVKKFSQPQDLLFIPGSPDETGFINGRAFVAAQIRRWLGKKVGQTQENEYEALDGSDVS